MTSCGFIGFGSAASAMAQGLREAGFGDIFFNVRTWPAPAYQKRARKSGAVYLPSLEALAKSSKLVFSCVIGSEAFGVAKQIAPHLQKGTIFVDLNTAPPEVKKESAALVEKGGISYVDAAMMGPVEKYRQAVPIIACGSRACDWAEAMRPYGANITVIPGHPGDSARIKLLRSIFQKGMMCLFMETLATAKLYNLDRLVLDSLAATFDGAALGEMAERLILKAAQHPGRIRKEMADVCELEKKAGINGLMARASAEIFELCAANPDPDVQNLDAALDLLGQRLSASPEPYQN